MAPAQSQAKTLAGWEGGGTGAQNKVSAENWNHSTKEKCSGELDPWRRSSKDGEPLCARNHARYCTIVPEESDQEGL